MLLERGLEAAIKTSMHTRCFTTHPLPLFAAGWWLPDSLHRWRFPGCSRLLRHPAAGAQRQQPLWTGRSGCCTAWFCQLGGWRE